MFEKLKKQSIRIIVLTIMLTLLCLLAINFSSYRHILYNDFVSKATVFSEQHSKNIDTYFRQIEQNLTIFTSHNGQVFDKTVSFNENAAIKSAAEDIARYKSNLDIYDVLFMSPNGDHIAGHNYFDVDEVRRTGIIDKIQTNGVYLYFNPKIPYCTTRDRNGPSEEEMLLYGTAIKNDSGDTVFYAIAAINAGGLMNALNHDKYFTKNTSVYLTCEDFIYPISEDNHAKIKKPAFSDKNTVSGEKNMLTTNTYNPTYNFSVITNTPANDSSLFANILMPVLIAIYIVIGIACIILAKTIIGYIIEPLESIYIKMKHTDLD